MGNMLTVAGGVVLGLVAFVVLVGLVKLALLGEVPAPVAPSEPIGRIPWRVVPRWLCTREPWAVLARELGAWRWVLIILGGGYILGLAVWALEWWFS